jgi:hypothetical protein
MKQKVLLDLFCGRFGWGRIFARRGWRVIGVDLVEPPEIPEGCEFVLADVLEIKLSAFGKFLVNGSREVEADLGVGSSPCEQFSVHGMRMFHKNPPYPELGIRLFSHTRELFEAANIPYVMENVLAAQQFVGEAICHAGPFYLWHNFGNWRPQFGHPLKMPKGITKGIDVGSSKLVKTMTKEQKREYRAQFIWNQAWSSSKKRKSDTAKAAEIPEPLANAVADYAECLLEQRTCA